MIAILILIFLFNVLLGDLQPSRVRADVSVTLNVKKDVQEEWENLRKHDVCFLLTVKPILPIGMKNYNYLMHLYLYIFFI